MRTLFRSEEETTPSGILKVGDTDFQPAMHANRISEVVMLPDELYFSLAWTRYNRELTESMPWRTDMQIKVGDMVWHDYMNSLNCCVIDVEDSDEQYKLLNYYDLYVAKRKILNMSVDQLQGNIISGYGYTFMEEESMVFSVIPLNGYVLCKEVMEERGSEMDVLDKHVDKRFGEVAFVGKKNYGYLRERIGRPPIEKDFDGEMNLVLGDIIVKKNPNIHIMLEDPLHTRFNKKIMYFITQRKNIYAKL